MSANMSTYRLEIAYHLASDMSTNCREKLSMIESKLPWWMAIEFNGCRVIGTTHKSIFNRHYLQKGFYNSHELTTKNRVLIIENGC